MATLSDTLKGTVDSHLADTLAERVEHIQTATRKLTKLVEDKLVTIEYPTAGHDILDDIDFRLMEVLITLVSIKRMLI